MCVGGGGGRLNFYFLGLSFDFMLKTGNSFSFSETLTSRFHKIKTRT